MDMQTSCIFILNFRLRSQLLLTNQIKSPELARDLRFHSVVTFGDYEEQVNQLLTSSDCQILNCGNNSRHRNASGQSLLSTISSLIAPGDAAILIGAVNIHTPQASRLMEAIPGQC